MKIRKSLVAAATALTVVTAGVSAPAFAQSSANFGSSQTPTTPAPAEGDNGDNKNETTDGSSDAKPDEIKNWIGVFTAVISALGALFAFVTKYIIK